MKGWIIGLGKRKQTRIIASLKIYDIKEDNIQIKIVSYTILWYMLVLRGSNIAGKTCLPWSSRIWEKRKKISKQQEQLLDQKSKISPTAVTRTFPILIVAPSPSTRSSTSILTLLFLLLSGLTIGSRGFSSVSFLSLGTSSSLEINKQQRHEIKRKKLPGSFLILF